MRKILCAALAAVVLSTLLPGCAETGQTVKEHPKTAIGTGAGVAGGAVVGGIIGGKRGAIIGGLLGALTGGVIGHYYDEREKDLAQTGREHGYSAPEGTRIRLESVRANPAVLSPGETVNINLTFAVLTPTADRQVPVKETREIRRNQVVVGKTSIDVTREGGTWKSTVPVTLPANASPGKYSVIATIETPQGIRDTGETFFQVK